MGADERHHTTATKGDSSYFQYAKVIPHPVAAGER